MSLIGILDFFTFILSLSCLIVILIGWNSQLSIISRLSLLAFFAVISFYYLSNFLEWSGISDALVIVEDYVAILAPLAWFFFIYTYLQTKTEKVMKENQMDLEDACRYTEFYKDLFTHDIRNILQNILFANDIFEQSTKDLKQSDNVNEILTLIKEQVLRGENLISNVTKLSEIRNSPLPVHSVVLSDVLENSVNQIKKVYEHRRIIVQIIKNDQKFLVRANNLLQKVIENILLNAIMHNKSETIEILVKSSKFKTDQIRFIKVEFIDNGLGITDERKKEIFITREEEDKFRTGLGFSTITKIIEYYNGKIWVEDRVKEDYSKGSNFILLIPEA